MAKLQDINHEGLKTAIIDLQVSPDLIYYGYFAMYFDFVEDPTLPAAAGVCIEKRQFKFAYNVEYLNKYEKMYGKNFFKFLIIHECQHILLGHQARTGSRNKQVANIAMDMVINTMIETDHKLTFDDFYYSNKKYEEPGIVFDGRKYDGLQMFEEVYEQLIQDNPDVDSEGNEQGGGDPKDCESCGGSGHANGEGTPGDGQGEPCPDCGGTGKEQGSGSGEDKEGEGKPGLVDSHREMQDDGKEMSSSDKAIMDSMVKEIHESLKARGYAASEGIENAFAFEKKKPIVNVYKRVFGNGRQKSSTYRKLSRRNSALKGKRKESKDVNIILDTSGSLWNDINEIMPVVVGNYNIYLVQCDTEVKYAGHVKTLNDWKKVAMKGGGGTTMQPAIDHLIKEKRNSIQTIFVSDFYTEDLNFDKFKGEVTFVKSRGAANPTFHNCIKYKVIEAFRD